MKKIRAPYTPKAGERERAIEHVVYEYTNFVCASDLVGKAGTTVNTLVWDVFFLNCRKLYDFFTKPATNEDDVQARHYYAGAVPPFSLPTWQDIGRDMDKKLAHITYSRNTLRATTGAENEALLREFKIAFEHFLKTMDATYRKGFIDRLQKEKTKLKGQADEYAANFKAQAEACLKNKETPITLNQLRATVQGLHELIASIPPP